MAVGASDKGGYVNDILSEGTNLLDKIGSWASILSLLVGSVGWLLAWLEKVGSWGFILGSLVGLMGLLTLLWLKKSIGRLFMNRPWKPNMTLTEVFKRKLCVCGVPDELDFYEEKLMRAAHEGQIQVWGKQQLEQGGYQAVESPTFGLEVKIPKDYWETNKIAWITLHGTERTDATQLAKTYGKLRFNRKQLINAGLIEA